MTKLTTIQLFKNIQTLVQQSRRELYTIANTTLTETYFHIGRMIVEYEQQGKSRALYAKETLLTLSDKLSNAVGKGFSVDNLENMRKFYLLYKKIMQSIFQKIKFPSQWLGKSNHQRNPRQRL